MHKIYLTEPEVSVINGADVIVEECGGFPSMENGRLCSIKMEKSKDDFGYNVVLLFDIEKWASDSALYMDIPKISHRFIEMSFCGVSNVYINHPNMSSTCGEIKFNNTPDRKKMCQDSSPERVPVISRPFCTFYIRNDSNLVFDFDERECKISARFKDQVE